MTRNRVIRQIGTYCWVTQRIRWRLRFAGGDSRQARLGCGQLTEMENRREPLSRACPRRLPNRSSGYSTNSYPSCRQLGKIDIFQVYALIF